MLESSYEACLAFELTLKNLNFKTQVSLPLIYRGNKLLDVGYKLDLLIEDQVIVELKAVDNILPIHKAQLMTYMKIAKKNVGLLINFNVEILKEGIVRRVI